MLYREAGQFKTSYAADMAIFPIRQDRIGLIALLVFAFVGIPLLAHFHLWPLGSDYFLRAILIPFLILSLAAIGVNILVGYCGQISLGSGAFMAIGAYSAYKFGTGVHIPLEFLGTEIRIAPLPMVVSILLGGLMSAIVGILFGMSEPSDQGPLSRRCDARRAVLLRLGLPAREVVHELYAVRFRRRAGSLLLRLSRPFADRALSAVPHIRDDLRPHREESRRGNIGRQWMAIRDMDIAAELMGIRPLYAKLTAFAVSSFIVGVAGALWAFIYLGAWEPLAFSIDRSLQLLFMVIIGGLGSILGSFLGAAFILILPIFLDQVPHALGVPVTVETVSHLVFIVTGALICYLLIVEPHGFARLWSIAKEKLRLWPFPY